MVPAGAVVRASWWSGGQGTPPQKRLAGGEGTSPACWRGVVQAKAWFGARLVRGGRGSWDPGHSEATDLRFFF